MKSLPPLSSNKLQVLAPALFLLFCCTHHFFTLTHAQTQTRRRHNQRALNLFKPTRIINGKEATPSRYPYIASLQLYPGDHFCGGSIIAPDIVLTAAHCMEGTQDFLDIYHVVVGRHDLEEYSKGQTIEIKREASHPLYNYTGTYIYDNDFSVVQLAEPIRDEEGIGMVKLNSDSAVPEVGAAATLMGWGDTNPAKGEFNISDVLMETEVFAMSNEQCEMSNGTVGTSVGQVFVDMNGRVSENMLCAWANETDSCQGDSGGPLVIKGNTPDQDLLVGVVSWDLEEFPGVNSRVSAQYEWIREQVCGLSSAPPAYFQCTEEMMFTTTPSSQPSTPQPTTSLMPTLSGGRKRLLIVINLDEHPEDTGWSLATFDGKDIIFDLPIGSYEGNDKFKRYEYDFEVDGNLFYQLKVKDVFGNGFEGTIDVYDSAIISSKTRLVGEPGFSEVSGEEVSHVFFVGEDPSNVLTLVFDFQYQTGAVQPGCVACSGADRTERELQCGPSGPYLVYLLLLLC